MLSLPNGNVTVSLARLVFLIDSGATHHCVREKALFSKFRPGKHVVKVASDGKTVAAMGKGDVVLTVPTSVTGDVVQMTFHDMFFVPGLTNNILSTSKFVCRENIVVFISTGHFLSQYPPCSRPKLKS
jgi:hypothetical protein